MPVLQAGVGVPVSPPNSSDEIIVGHGSFHDRPANMACSAEDLILSSVLNSTIRKCWWSPVVLWRVETHDPHKLLDRILRPRRIAACGELELGVLWC